MVGRQSGREIRAYQTQVKIFLSFTNIFTTTPRSGGGGAAAAAGGAARGGGGVQQRAGHQQDRHLDIQTGRLAG